MCVAAMHAYGRRSACANQCSRGMVDEGIQVSVHGLAGPLLRCVLPRGSTLASLRQAIKAELGIPNRLQTLIIGGELVSPLEALAAVCCRDCIDITLVLCQPACDRCGRGDSLRWCGGRNGIKKYNPCTYQREEQAPLRLQVGSHDGSKMAPTMSPKTAP